MGRRHEGGRQFFPDEILQRDDPDPSRTTKASAAAMPSAIQNSSTLRLFDMAVATPVDPKRPIWTSPDVMAGSNLPGESNLRQLILYPVAFSKSPPAIATFQGLNMSWYPTVTSPDSAQAAGTARAVTITTQRYKPMTFFTVPPFSDGCFGSQHGCSFSSPDWFIPQARVKSRNGCMPRRCIPQTDV